ncbi:MAG: tetratricopeptide repeat protein [Chloroflexota bacterium]|nr:tetratricopeptide repeat protein [Chloroflexota bacterium]
MDEIASLGYWLRRRRKALDLTRDALARRVGCAAVTLAKIEADERRPSQQIAERLADALQLTAEEQAVFLEVVRGERLADALAVSTRPVAAAPPPPGQPAWQARSHNLPRQRYQLIGRERELAEVCALLARDDVGLVTLTGPGGTGKTRLGLQVATALLGDFPDGVWFVDLAPISDPALIPATITVTLGLKETRGEALTERLTTYLRDKQILLVLDNFEQVVAAAPLVAELLNAAPRVKALVTSRSALHLYGEQEYPVPPLAVPDRSHPLPIEQLTQYGAIQLFIQRARSVKPDFQVTSTNAPATAEICACLDGLPLAIELAAARVKLFPPQALLGRLAQRLKLLTGGACDLPARHQTLRGAIDWSYHLLTPDEQTLFARLGVFVGGWTVAAAEAVCPGAGDDPGAVLDHLASLVDKSLVRQQEGLAGEPRFTLLETIREYALEHLEASGEAEALRRQHARYYLGWVEALQAQFRPAHQRALLAQVAAETSNLAAALEWTVDRDELDLGLRLVDALDFWTMGAFVPAERALKQALLSRHTTLPPRQRAQALGHLGRMAWYRGDYAQALAYLEEGLALCRDHGDPAELAQMLRSVADVHREQGEYARAEPLYAEALARCEALGDTYGIAATYHARGELALLQGDYARALPLAQAALALFRELGVQWGIIHGLFNQGVAAQHLGDVAEARRSFQESLRLAQTLEHVKFIAVGLIGCAGVAVAAEPQHGHGTGDAERAIHLLGAAEARYAEMGQHDMTQGQRQVYAGAMTAARAHLDDATWERAWAEGRAMTLEQAVAYALKEVPNA